VHYILFKMLIIYHVCIVFYFRFLTFEFSARKKNIEELVSEVSRLQWAYIKYK